MIDRAGIDHPGEVGAGRHPGSDFAGIVAHGLDPDVEGLQSLQQGPGIEGAERGSGVAQEEGQVVLHVFGIAQDRAAHDPALAVDMLGRRIDHHVGAEGHGLLQHRRGKDIVHHQPSTRLVGQIGNRFEVDHFQPRIGGGFQEHRPGGPGQCLAPLVEIGAVDDVDLDPVAGQDFRNHEQAGAEERAGAHHVVAGVEHAHQRSEDRRHARRRRAASIVALQQRHALLEHGDGGIGETGIDIFVVLPLECRFGLLGGKVNIARSCKYRLAGFLEAGPVGSAANEIGPGPQSIGSLGVVGHGALLHDRASKNPGRRPGLCSSTRPFSDLFYVDASRPAQISTNLGFILPSEVCRQGMAGNGGAGLSRISAVTTRQVDNDVRHRRPFAQGVFDQVGEGITGKRFDEPGAGVF